MNRWFSARDLSRPCAVRLFCLPHAGSGATSYYRWRRVLPRSVAVCPVMLPGREMRLAEPSLPDAGALADALLAASADVLDRPYAIFGHSMGALLAYEWAVRIAAAGLPAPVRLFASGRNAPQIPYTHAVLHRLGEEDFVEALRTRYGGLPEGFLADPEMREVFLPILRADLRLVETYRPNLDPRLPCGITASAGVRDATVTGSGLDGWAERTSAACEVFRFAGDHFYQQGAGEQALVKLIAERLNA